MEEFRDLAVNDQAELERIKAGAMDLVITTYTLAAGLMAAGMNW